jgi:acetyl esterase/lipase
VNIVKTNLTGDALMTTESKLVIPLWPGGAPGSETWDQVEREMIPSGWELPLVHNVTRPSLTVYPAEQPSGAAVIIAPGGAFHFLAIEHEGRQVAEWLSARGITAFILKYRVRRTGDDPWKDSATFNWEEGHAEMQALHAMAHADAGQAMRTVRARAAEWGVDPARVGLMGFSAGGMVTAQLALHYTPETRPAFAAPIYGAIFEEVPVPADAPPLFLACAQDDEMAEGGSLLMYSCWSKAKRPVEMHIYAKGGHGFGMLKRGQPTDTWIERFADWLKEIEMI